MGRGADRSNIRKAVRDLSEHSVLQLRGNDSSLRDVFKRNAYAKVLFLKTMLGYPERGKPFVHGHHQGNTGIDVFSYLGLDIAVGACTGTPNQDSINKLTGSLAISLKNHARLVVFFDESVVIADYVDGVIHLDTRIGAHVHQLLDLYNAVAFNDNTYIIPRNVDDLFSYVSYSSVRDFMRGIRLADYNDLLKLRFTKQPLYTSDIVIEAVDNVFVYSKAMVLAIPVLSQQRNSVLSDSIYIKEVVKYIVSSVRDNLKGVKGATGLDNIDSDVLKMLGNHLTRKGVMRGLIQNSLEKRSLVAVYRGWDK